MTVNLYDAFAKSKAQFSWKVGKVMYDIMEDHLMKKRLEINSMICSSITLL